MSSHNITDSPNFHRTTRFVGQSPDDPDGLHRTLGEDSDLDIKIYRKNGSQLSLRSASSTQGENIRFLPHTGRMPRVAARSTPYGSTHSLDSTGPLPNSLLVYPLLGTGLKPAKRGKSPVQSYMDDSDEFDILLEDWKMWLPRPKKAHTLDPNFSTRSRPKKTRPKYPDYIAEITAPLAKEEDFDFMIVPAFYNSQVGALKNATERRNKRRSMRNRFFGAVRKMFH